MSNKKFFVNNAVKIIPSVNDTPYKRILAIGDVHGKFEKFLSLWEKISVTDNDLVIFLGDYVDRGEGVAEMLKWVMNHRHEKNIVFLRGNHEQMMIDAFRSHGNDDAKLLWVYNGGDKTIHALVDLSAKKIFATDEILDFAEKLPLSHRIKIGGREYFFCHAGVDGKVPLDAQNEEFLLWAREKFFNTYDGDAVIVSGHSPLQAFPQFGVVDDPRPIKVPNRNILMLDTGGFVRGGKISAVDILTGEYWQSDDGTKASADTPSLIFVCTGNTCRSPMAKYILRHLLAEAGLANKIFVDSAACHARGSGLSNRAYKTLKSHDIPFDEHVTKNFTPELYKNFQCVIALDKDIFEQVVKISGGDPDKKILMLTDADGKEIDVADPWLTDNYQKAYDDIFRGCEVLLKEIIDG